MTKVSLCSRLCELGVLLAAAARQSAANRQPRVRLALEWTVFLSPVRSQTSRSREALEGKVAGNHRL